MRTEKEELAMFGCTELDLREFVALYIGPGAEEHFQTRENAAVSLLSDAQEEISLGRGERARQAINRAKWMLS